MNNALVTQSAPYSQEAEEASLGALLINPEVFRRIAAFLKKEDFFFVRHGYIFEAMKRLHARNEPIDYLLLINELKTLGWLEEIGGPAYITYLINNTPTSIYAEVYSHLVERASVRRRIMMAADEFKALALNEEIILEQVITQIEEKLKAIRNGRPNDTIRTLQEGAEAYRQHIQELIMGNGMFGFPTGLTAYDTRIGGARRGEVMLIGADTGIGKTFWLLNVANYMRSQGLQVKFDSTEMTLIEIMGRLVSIETGITRRMIAERKVDPQELGRVHEALDRLEKFKQFIDYNSRLTPALSMANAERVQDEHGLDVLIVDHLHDMSGGEQFDRRPDRLSELEYIGECYKEFAKRRNIAIIAGCQVVKDIGNRQDKRPHHHDIWFGTRLTHKAQVITMLYRDRLYDEQTLTPNVMELITTKVRDGGTVGTDSVYSHPVSGKITDGVIQEVNLNDDPPANVKRAEFKGNPYAGQQPSSKRGMAIGGTHVSMSSMEDSE